MTMIALSKKVWKFPDQLNKLDKIIRGIYLNVTVFE
jgi:hypothetical protein